ncbi:MAG TPA: flagellar filament capping protein FliD [Solirubrobacterales bacterium]|nr:flagellar filament capping protein FliD [Solirubrobacterales bacterium]
MSPVTISGLGSTLDTESIIEGLMKVERLPQSRLERRQGQVKARETALQGILNKLNEVNSALQSLRSPTLWSDVQKVTSSSTAVTAELAGGAGPGGYQVEVTQLARATQRTYEFTPNAAASTITVGGQTIELKAGATLADAVAAINSNHETGVSAVAVGGKLVLSSRTTGAASTVSAAGAGLAEEASKARPGQDTLYSIDGVAGSYATNVIAEAIPGVTLTVSALTSGPTTISVTEPAPDTTSIAAKIKTFVSAYNSTVELIQAKVTEETVKEPKTQEEANKGVLFGDGALNSLLSGMRTALSESGLGALGVSTGAPSTAVTATSASVRGLLTFEESKLTALLKENPVAVKEAISGANGFVTDLEPLVEVAAKPGGGLSERISAATKEAAQLRAQMTKLEERLTVREARLHAQFAAMETALAKSKSESEWLAGQLKGLEANKS